MSLADEWWRQLSPEWRRQRNARRDTARVPKRPTSSRTTGGRLRPTKRARPGRMG